MPSPPLPLGLTPEALAAAAAEGDPGSLAAATRLRAAYGPELATVALHQVALRRQARAKFGDRAGAMFFTRPGLEQATRPAVAERHAQRLVEGGVRRVVDLGCGIGADALAFVDAGLEVVAIERDAETAAVARANLAGRAEVIEADAEAVADELLGPGVAVFADPARRNDRGRLWRVEDFSPSWILIERLLDGSRVAAVKLGPALPHALIPDSAEAVWTTHRGETVEVTLWAGPGATPGLRAAEILPGPHRLITEPTEALPIGAIADYLYEPDGAVIRSGGIAQLGVRLNAHLLDPQIAYLTGAEPIDTPFATRFAVHEQLPYDLKRLRRALADRGIGRLEIKKRGLELDPADLRRKLKPAGPHAATLILTRTPAGAIAILAGRDEPGPAD